MSQRGARRPGVIAGLVWVAVAAGVAFAVVFVATALQVPRYGHVSTIETDHGQTESDSEARYRTALLLRSAPPPSEGGVTTHVKTLRHNLVEVRVIADTQLDASRHAQSLESLAAEGAGGAAGLVEVLSSNQRGRTSPRPLQSAGIAGIVVLLVGALTTVLLNEPMAPASRGVGYTMAIALAAVAAADARIPRLQWDPWDLGPWHRALVLGAVWTVLAAVGLAHLGRRNGSSRYRTAVVLALFIWCGVSSLGGLHPVRSLLLVVALAAIALGARAASLLRVGWVALLGGSALVVATSLVDRVISEGPEVDVLRGPFTGFTTDLATFGHISGLLAVASATTIALQRPAGGGSQRRTASTAGLVALLCLGSLGIVASGSSTALLALGAATVTLAATVRSHAVGRAFAAICVAAVIAAACTALVFDLSTFTDRIEIWEATASFVQERPILGAGPGSGAEQFALQAVDEQLVIFTPSSHNLAADIAREIGVPGLALAAAAIAAMRPWRDPASVPLVVYLAIAALTMTTTGIPGLIVAAWFVVMANGHYAGCRVEAAGRPTTPASSFTPVVGAIEGE